MAVPVLVVAEDLAAALGDPTIEALSDRWSPEAPCEVCARALGRHPASIIARSTADVPDHLHLRPAHAHCSRSRWEKDAPAHAVVGNTVRAELVVVLLPAGDATAAFDITPRHPLTLLVVNPSVSAARYQVVRPGEAVDLDMLTLANCGWSVFDETTIADPTAPLRICELSPEWLTVQASESVSWRVPATPGLERAIRLRSGMLVALGHRPSVGEISRAGPQAGDLLMPALEYGDLLSCWAWLREGLNDSHRAA